MLSFDKILLSTYYVTDTKLEARDKYREQNSQKITVYIQMIFE